MEKKVLFLSASVGFGHVKAAQAVMQRLQSKDEKLEIRHIDVLSLMPDFFYKPFLRLYLVSLTRCSALYGRLYHRFDRTGGCGALQRLLCRLLAHRLKARLRDFAPRYVLCTHILGAGIMAAWNERYGDLPYGCCATDFVLHRSWLHQSAEEYFIDNETQLARLVAFGIARTHCHLYGIPHDGAPTEKQAARRVLSIGEAERFVFIFGGGCGLLAMDVEHLIAPEKPYHYVVCCGKNEALRRRLCAAFTGESVRVLGFVENIPAWLCAADVVITKAGGVSLSEILSSGTDCIIYRPFAGQEAENAAYCAKRGWVYTAYDEEECRKKIDEIFRIKTSPVKRKLSALAKTDAAERIAEHIYEELCDKL